MNMWKVPLSSSVVILVLPLEDNANRTYFNIYIYIYKRYVTRANPSAGVKGCCFNVFRALTFYTPKDSVHALDTLYTEYLSLNH